MEIGADSYWSRKLVKNRQKKKFSKMTSICNIVLLLSFHGNKLALKFFVGFAKL